MPSGISRTGMRFLHIHNKELLQHLSVCIWNTCHPFSLSPASGSPVAMDVRTDRMPDKTEALATNPQFTSDIANAVPIVATAVCATVLIARIKAHFQNSFVNITFHPFPFCFSNLRAGQFLSPTLLVLLFASEVHQSSRL